jgi:lipopolysaccharide export system permease protein
MRQTDRLIFKEIVGPWTFGVGMFTALLMAATFLGRLTGYVVDGVPFGQIAELFMLLLPSMLTKTFSMAVLLAALLSFGRLSSDSEIVAMKAGGASVYRIVAPAGLFAIAVALLTFAFNETIVPSSARASVALGVRIVQAKKVTAAMPVSKTQIENGKLRLGILAKNANAADGSLEGVTVVQYDDSGKESLIMLAKTVTFTNLANWRVRGGAVLFTPDFRFRTTLDGDVWPEGMAQPRGSFTDLLKERDDDFDSMSMSELATVIRNHRINGTRTSAQIANYEYGYWNKLSIPLAAVVFGVLGAVLGIRNHRTGTAAGFALAVAIIFGYYMLANFMAVWSQNGAIPPWAAAFGPIVIGAICAGFLVHQRNQ